jgi:hypothetical protein
LLLNTTAFIRSQQEYIPASKIAISGFNSPVSSNLSSTDMRDEFKPEMNSKLHKVAKEHSMLCKTGGDIIDLME